MKESAKSIAAVVITLLIVAVLSGCSSFGGSKGSYGGAVGAFDNARRTPSGLL